MKFLRCTQEKIVYVTSAREKYFFRKNLRIILAAIQMQPKSIYRSFSAPWASIYLSSKKCMLDGARWTPEMNSGRRKTFISGLWYSIKIFFLSTWNGPICSYNFNTKPMEEVSSYFVFLKKSNRVWSIFKRFFLMCVRIINKESNQILLSTILYSEPVAEPIYSRLCAKRWNWTHAPSHRRA